MSINLMNENKQINIITHQSTLKFLRTRNEMNSIRDYEDDDDDDDEMFISF